MAAAPLSPPSDRQGKFGFSLPMPPPPLHAKSSTGLYENERPQTPTSAGFTSPFATPQGSPSKRQLPPGANDLPNVFDNAMKLNPVNATKPGRQQLGPHSPNKAPKSADDPFDTSVLQPEVIPSPGSPLRKSNQENTPPGIRLAKEASYTPNQAAMSRQEPYQSRENSDPAARGRFNTQRGLTPEELEKLQWPKVKRLANVTQICTNHIKSIRLGHEC